MDGDQTEAGVNPISDQIIVVTGGSSGIGRATALEAARRGAKLALFARGEAALAATAGAVAAIGGEVVTQTGDVAEAATVEAFADAVVARFGRVDTWVNAAAVSVYGEFMEVPADEFRRVIEVDLLGVANGCRAAVRVMRPPAAGGSIVNISSGLGDRAVPLQSAYCAAKHAVNGLSESLRTELEHDGLPIRVAVVKPASIDTPFFRHARSRMAVAPKPIPPVYDARVAAEAILYAATHPVRDLPVGGASAALGVAEVMAPRLLDLQLRRLGYALQRDDTIDPSGKPDNLWQGAVGSGAVAGGYGGRRFSLYNWLRQRPTGRATALTAAALAGWTLARRAER